MKNTNLYEMDKYVQCWEPKVILASAPAMIHLVQGKILTDVTAPPTEPRRKDWKGYD